MKVQKKMNNDNDEWEVVRDKDGKILYSYNKTESDKQRKNPPHIINPITFDRILAKNVKMMEGDLCFDCESNPCICESE